MRKRGRETCQRYIDGLPLTRPQLGTWPTTQARALTGNFDSQVDAQATGPHQPGPNFFFLITIHS